MSTKEILSMTRNKENTFDHDFVAVALVYDFFYGIVEKIIIKDHCFFIITSNWFMNFGF
jgi:hypothetical protein